MKRLLLLVLLSTNMIVYSQELPIDKETGKFTFTEVVYVSDSTITQERLYNAAREWFVNTFSSSNDVIQLADKISGKIIGKANFPVQRNMYLGDGWICFTISIYVKDGRYKYIVTDFSHTAAQGPLYNGGILEDEKPDCGGLYMTKKGWMQLREQTNTQITTLLINLEETMNREPKKTEEW